MLSPWLTLCLCVWCCLYSCHARSGSVLYGTENGYDAGGTEAICFYSTWNVSQDPTPPSEIERINNEMFTGLEQVELLKNCFNGTSLTVQPVTEGFDSTMVTSSNYTFQLVLESNLTNINRNMRVEELNGTSAVHFRLLMCNAFMDGFCNPMVDTRSIEDTLSRNQTDLNATLDSLQDKFKYKAGDVLIGVEDGRMVFSRWVAWKFKELQKGSDLYKATINITIQLPPQTPAGAYFFIGHAVMVFTVDGSYDRVDIADTIPTRIVEVTHPPKILRVSNRMKVTLAIMIGIFGTISLGSFVFLIVHRNHPVLKLSQVAFLSAVAGACFVVIVGTFTFLPTRDIFCSINGPIILIPSSIIGAILVGRVWRVYVTLSAVLTLGREKGKFHDMRSSKNDPGQVLMRILSFIASVPFMFKKHKDQCSLRRAATTAETLALIVALSMPQVVVQLFGSIYYRPELIINYSEEAKMGRVVCSEELRWLHIVGMLLLAIVYLLAIVVSCVASDLPSAFNEKQQIFQAATFCATSTFIAVVFIQITDQPTTHPDVWVSYNQNNHGNAEQYSLTFSHFSLNRYF
jgi:hypothetical protein